MCASWMSWVLHAVLLCCLRVVRLESKLLRLPIEVEELMVLVLVEVELLMLLVLAEWTEVRKFKMSSKDDSCGIVSDMMSFNK